MKRVDLSTPIGLIVGVTILIFGIVYNGGTEGILSFVDIPSVLIVVGGLTAGLFMSFPVKEMKKLFVLSKQAFIQEDYDLKGLIQTFVKLSEKARREGLLALEVEAENLDDPFIRKGILLAVDGLEPDVITDIMTAEITAMEERHRKGRGIVERAGEYAPAWGMIGTLIGLVLMLKNLNDPESLGPNMALAIITTLYGAVLANLVFLPIANKLAEKTEQEVFYKQIIIEGIIGVQSGQNPRILEEKLSAFLSTKERLEEDEGSDKESGTYEV